jgi:hypothetical protein
MDYQEKTDFFSDFNQEYEHPKKIKFLKTAILVLGLVFILMLIFSVLFMLGEITPKKVSNQGLIVGASLSLKENSSVKLKVDGGYHTLKIDSVEKDSVNIIIQSDPISFNLKAEEIKEIDLNGDGEMDLRIKLIEIIDGKAVIAVKNIKNEKCFENWKCSDWSECKEGIKKRECIDLNYCGNSVFKPIEKQKCSEEQSFGFMKIWRNNSNLEISNKSNELINDSKYYQDLNNSGNISSFKEEGSINNSFNLSSKTVNITKAQDTQTNGSSPVFICNKEWDSFIENSRNCTISNIICNSTIKIPGKWILEDAVIYYELKGIRKNSCAFYYEYRKLNAYSNVSLNSSNYDISLEINKINLEFKEVQGKKIICYYPFEILSEKLNKIKEGTIPNLDFSDENYCNEFNEEMSNSLGRVI